MATFSACPSHLHLLFLIFVGFFLAVNGAAIQRRGVINHDAVVGFPQAVPNTTEGSSYLKFKPWLDVPHGCVPFPAVDLQGNMGGGLSINDGIHNHRCGKNLGQVYVRGTWYKGIYGIMYSWYMPKDQPSIGLGHRHDWENVVVWIDSLDSLSQKILAVSPSAHGNYKKFVGSAAPIDGSRAKIRYFSIWPTNHQLGVTSKHGGEQPLIAWDSLTVEARYALSTTDFGAATIPFKDSTFEGNLAKAYFM